MVSAVQAPAKNTAKPALLPPAKFEHEQLANLEALGTWHDSDRHN